MPFTPEFLAFWNGIGFKKGKKEKAFQAYVKQGCPDPVMMADRWTQYVASLDDPKYAEYVSTWINGGGHLETYGPPKKATAAGGGFVPSDYPEFD
jgi:hypothetical protein